MQRAHCVEHGDDHYADVGEDSCAHVGYAERAQQQAGKLHAEGENDVFVHDADALARNFYRSGYLQRIVVHEHDVCGLDGDKVSEVERLLGETTGKAKLAFVGDGINDAPVLSRADIGIAMGAMGSDAAIEAADVVLMDDDPLKISKAIKISRKCIRIVYENIIFALGVKFSCLLLVALGAADMGAAIFADVGVMVIAVLNAMRALRANA